MSRLSNVSRRKVLAGIGAASTLPLWSGRAWSAETVKLGTLCPLTGAGGSFGPTMELAVRNQIDRINALGGVGGFQLQGVFENSETDPNAAVIAAKKLISVDGVSAILGEWASGESLAVSPLCIAGKVVQFTSTGDDKITDQAHDGFIFRTEAGGVLWGKVFAEAAMLAGAKRAATAAVQASYAIAYTSNFQTFYKEAGGEIVGEPVIYAASATSYRGELDKIFSGQPELVFVMGYTPDTIILVKDAFRQGLTAHWLVPGYVGLDPEFIKAVGAEATENVNVLDPALDDSSPAWAKFAEALGDKAKGASYAAQTYDQINLVALAIEATKKGDGAGIRDGIRQVTAPEGTVVSNVEDGIKLLREGKTIKYQGASSECTFDEKGNIKSGHFAIYEIRDGKAEIKTHRSVSL